jgi:hypothetical protein
MANQEMTHEEWKTEARKRFGDDSMGWRFVCPSCGHIASVADWKAAGAGEGEIAFSCIGRRLGSGDKATFRMPPGWREPDWSNHAGWKRAREMERQSNAAAARGIQ